MPGCLMYWAVSLYFPGERWEEAGKELKDRMSNNTTSQSFFRRNLKFIISGLIICALLVMTISIVYKSLLDLAKRDAEQHAVGLSESIPLPDSTMPIQTWSGDRGTSFECHAGFSSTLYGSDLSLTEVVQYYRNNFFQRGWNVLPRETDNVFGENGERLGVDEADILIMGIEQGGVDYIINVNICRSNSCTSFPPIQEGDDFIDGARKKYETVYWLGISYKPENVRDNFCGCCSGG